MRSHRRWLVVLSIMAIAMVLCAVATQQLLTKPAPPPWPPRMPRETANVLRNGIGLLFALHAGVALFVTRRWHRVAVPGRAALRALLSVGLSFPVLFWGGMVLACLVVRALPIRNARVEDQISRVATYATMVTSSAAGAWWIARVLARLTGATNRLLCAAMVACGALWPFVLPLVYDARNDGVWAVWFRDPMGVGPLLAWQLAIGVAAAAWFVRAGDARAPRDPSDATTSLR
jgi:hypothetical protein